MQSGSLDYIHAMYCTSSKSHNQDVNRRSSPFAPDLILQVKEIIHIIIIVELYE